MTPYLRAFSYDELTSSVRQKILPASWWSGGNSNLDLDQSIKSIKSINHIIILLNTWTIWSRMLERHHNMLVRIFIPPVLTQTIFLRLNHIGATRKFNACYLSTFFETFYSYHSPMIRVIFFSSITSL